MTNLRSGGLLTTKLVAPMPRWRPVPRPRLLRLLEAGTRGPLTVLAAPIDDLWHRLFGIDVTLWSPPHLLGILGGVVNSWGCLLIAREIYPEGAAPIVRGEAVNTATTYGWVARSTKPRRRSGWIST